MQKEWLAQLVALLLFFLDSIIYVERDGLFISEHIISDLGFIIYHLLLFLLVNYVLIPKFFYERKYFSFFGLLVLSIIIFGIVEEGVVEKILAPDSRGVNDVTWQSIYWFFGEILVPLMTFITIKFVFDNFRQKQRIEKIEQNKLRNELKLLKSQIQPHILFNSLNSIYHFALKKSDALPDLVIKLSNVLRYIVYEAHGQKVPVSKELSFIQDYIHLQEVQYKGRGNIEYDIAQGPMPKAIKIAPFVLIPFIENCFKHSFGTKTDQVFIKISIELEGEEIILSTENNYEEKKSGSGPQLIQGGIGLKNVKKRLRLLYDNRYDLTINPGKDRYFTNLRLKLI